jgi:hypothetical protein
MAKIQAPKGPVHPAQGVSLGLIVPPWRTTPTGAFMRDWMNRPFRPVVVGALFSPRLRLGLYEPAFQAGAGCAGEFPWAGERGRRTFPKRASRDEGSSVQSGLSALFGGRCAGEAPWQRIRPLSGPGSLPLSGARLFALVALMVRVGLVRVDVLFAYHVG